MIYKCSSNGFVSDLPPSPSRRPIGDHLFQVDIIIFPDKDLRHLPKNISKPFTFSTTKKIYVMPSEPLLNKKPTSE
ncbi:hypothetical protein B9Z55_023702 [Caenorhabditis nigoni]|uniref:Uncharacterized protein n=1 Tax=Caenorhabditis nigoni TaxID=1611254 RepID=A0A2G5SR88_9PELO|nr:hypothetical protein B9Z55_023702 [Caenorhabditis nigoni]